MKLDEFLSKKPLFYKEIDYTRVPRAFEFVKRNFKIPPIVHIIGTNGKGSTGRFLAQMLHLSGKSVGHYTSPHIFDFHERFWLNGNMASEQDLQSAHERLLEILPAEFCVSLSYFEYATLLAAVLFSECEYFICEAGVGGEFDATNVFDKRLSLFTPIGLDHTALLGGTLGEIARTKFNAMSGVALLNDDMDEICVHTAFLVAANRGAQVKFSSENLKTQDLVAIKKYADKFNLPDFLISNLALSAAAFIQLTSGSAAEILSDLGELNLNGRCQKIAPNITIDVGHNELAALAMTQRFEGKKLNLVFNAFNDKDIAAVLKAIKPIVKKVHIIEYETPQRELATDKVKDILTELNIEFCDFAGVSDDEEYLVFGSFYLVEAFLRGIGIDSAR